VSTVLSREDTAAQKMLLTWKADPIRMVREAFHVEPDAWQQDALMAYAAHQRVAMKACKGPGKTAVLAWMGLNFLACYTYPKIGATSITEDNIDNNLWPEFDKWMRESAFFMRTFRWTKTRIFNIANPENWFIGKRTWPKKANAEEQANTLAGLHADNVMWIGDETGGMPQAVMVAMEQIFSSCVVGKVVQSGNPTHTTGPLYRACTIDRDIWQVIQISGDPDNPKRSPRISIEHARQQIKSYGRDNPWVMVNILGEFPPSSLNTLLGVEDVERAMNRHLTESQYSHMQKRIGVDVARFGDDRTVIFPRQGLASFRPIIMRGARTTEIAARVAHASNRWGARGGQVEQIFVDDTGHWGHGVIDNLITAGYPVIPVVYHAKAIDPRYNNRRTEMWLRGADAIKAGAALPLIPEMVAELTEPTYTFVNGVFMLESKDQIKERLQFSPDLADAYFETYSLEDMPGEMLQRVRGQTKARTEFDPYRSAADGRGPEIGDGENGRALIDFDPNRL